MTVTHQYTLGIREMRFAKLPHRIPVPICAGRNRIPDGHDGAQVTIAEHTLAFSHDFGFPRDLFVAKRREDDGRSSV
jgi:hypothetical protein